MKEMEILTRLRNWFRKHGLPSKVTFYLLGIASTVWFLAPILTGIDTRIK